MRNSKRLSSLQNDAIGDATGNGEKPSRGSMASQRLSDAYVRRLRAPQDVGKHADGRGLYLCVLASGAKSWRYDYRLGGRKKITFGCFPDVSLAAARAKLLEARQLVADGKDPGQTRQAQKQKQRHAETLAMVYQDWLKRRRVAGTTATRNDILWRLHVLPALGHRPIQALTPADILPVLQAVEQRGRLASARRCRQLLGQLFRYAVASGRATRDVTADLRGALAPEATTHHAALTTPAEVGALLRAVHHYHGHESIANMLRLAPLLFVRPGELRHMRWDDVDWTAALWRIPPPQTKTRTGQLVPLARQAIVILSEQKVWAGSSPWVFPSLRTKDRPTSENTLNASLRRLGYASEQMRAHGFRAMARTLLAEALHVDPFVIECQLGHRPPGPLGAAYARAQYLPQRIEMMQRWANYLDELRK